jgi:hypothetical protein
MSEIRRWVAQKQFDEACTNFRSTWEMFLKFQIAFMVTNMACLTYLFKDPINPRIAWAFSAFFAPQCLMIAFSSFNLVKYNTGVTTHVEEASKELKSVGAHLGETMRDDAPCCSTSLPLDFGKAAAWCNVVGNLVLAAGWIGMPLVAVR